MKHIFLVWNMYWDNYDRDCCGESLCGVYSSYELAVAARNKVVEKRLADLASYRCTVEKSINDNPEMILITQFDNGRESYSDTYTIVKQELDASPIDYGAECH